MRHPSADELALYVGGDCGFLAEWRITRHLRRCATCDTEAEENRRARQALRECAAEMPVGVQWERLAEEMTGNIRVGLAAGECVGDFPSRRRIRPLFHWNIATSMVMLGVLFVAALVINLPAPQTGRLMSTLRRMVGSGPVSAPMMSAVPATAVLEASPQQIGMWSNGTAMTVVPPQTSDATARRVSLSLQGSASERVADGDTGQVTISQVYYAP